MRLIDRKTYFLWIFSTKYYRYRSSCLHYGFHEIFGKWIILMINWPKTTHIQLDDYLTKTILFCLWIIKKQINIWCRNKLLLTMIRIDYGFLYHLIKLILNPLMSVRIAAYTTFFLNLSFLSQWNYWTYMVITTLRVKIPFFNSIFKYQIKYQWSANFEFSFFLHTI